MKIYMRITYANNFNRNRNRKRVKKRTGNGKRQTIQIKRREREQNSTKFYFLLFQYKQTISQSLMCFVHDFLVKTAWNCLNMAESERRIKYSKKILKFKLFIKRLKILLFNFHSTKVINAIHGDQCLIQYNK